MGPFPGTLVTPFGLFRLIVYISELGALRAPGGTLFPLVTLIVFVFVFLCGHGNTLFFTLFGNQPTF
jgi:hypothetical protein